MLFQSLVCLVGLELNDGIPAQKVIDDDDNDEEYDHALRSLRLITYRAAIDR